MSIEKNANQPTFLDGWKEISNYLGKGVRTAQRYEQELGLPIRRTVGCGPLKQLFTGFSIEGHETVGVDVGYPGILVSPTFRGEQPPRTEHPNHRDRNKQCRNPTFKQILLIALEIRISRFGSLVPCDMGTYLYAQVWFPWLGPGG